MCELCGLCRSLINPGAIVCASCGAYRRRRLRPGMGILSLFLLAVGVLYSRLFPVAALLLIGVAIFVFIKARRVIWWRRFRG